MYAGKGIGVDLKAADIVAGIQAAGTDHRLKQGTGEFFWIILTEKSKQQKVEDESRNGFRRCGGRRSSVEDAVMAWERRASVVQTKTEKQLKGRISLKWGSRLRLHKIRFFTPTNV